MRALYVASSMIAGAFVGARGYEVFGHRRAIKGAVDHDRPLAVGLPAELGRLVVHHERVAERPHRQVEVLGPALGVAPVGAQVPSWPAPGRTSASSRPRCRPGLAGLGQRGAEDEVGESRHRPRGPAHRHDRGFEGPVDLPQCFAVRAAPLAVVAFSYVPAPVRVAGTGPPARRRPP